MQAQSELRAARQADAGLDVAPKDDDIRKIARLSEASTTALTSSDRLSNFSSELSADDEDVVLRTPMPAGTFCLKQLQAVAAAVARGADEVMAGDSSGDELLLRTPVAAVYDPRSLQAAAAAAARDIAGVKPKV